MALRRYSLAAVVLLSGGVILRCSLRIKSYPPNLYQGEALKFVAKNHTDNPSLHPDTAVSVRNPDGSSSRTSYSIIEGLRYQLPFTSTRRDYACRLGRFKYRYKRGFRNRVLEPKSILDKMNYTTFLNTSLKLLVLGDSVASQLAELLEEAMGATHDQRALFSTCASASPILGGGVLGTFRINRMFLRKHEVTGESGSWRRSVVHELLNHTYVLDQHTQIVGSFDAMVFRVPHGWVNCTEITREALLEGIELAHEVFGVSTVILLTLHLNNNILTMEDLLALAQVNQMIIDLAAEWTPTGGVEHVFVLDFASYTEQILTENAILLKQNTSNPGFALERLCGAKFNPSVAQICASQVVRCECVLNSFTFDGIHICAETLGGRVVAGIGCQLSCLDSDEKDIAACAARCSDTFMSLRPLDASGV